MIDSKKFLPRKTKASVISPEAVSKLGIVRVELITVDQLLKGSLAADKRAEEKSRKAEEQQASLKREGELEAKDDKTKRKKIKIPIPPVPFLDKIKNFITNLLVGWLALKLVDWAPIIQKWLPVVKKAAEVVGSITKGILDGLFWVVGKGYEMYDGIRNAVGNLFGEEGLKIFDELSGVLNKVVNGIIGVAALLATLPNRLNPFTPSPQPGTNLGSARPGFNPRQVARGNTNQQIRNYARRYGRRQAERRFGSQSVRGLGGRFARSPVTNLARRGVTTVLGRGGTKVGLKFMKNVISPIVKRIPFVGAFVDFLLNVFVFKEPPGRAAFKAIGAGLGLWIGGMIGSVIPVAGTFLGGLAGGVAGDQLGGLIYDMVIGSAGEKASGQASKIENQASYDKNSVGQTTFIPIKVSDVQRSGGSSQASVTSIGSATLVDNSRDTLAKA